MVRPRRSAPWLGVSDVDTAAMGFGRLWFWLLILAASVAAGAAYTILFGAGPPLAGSIHGLAIGLCVLAFDRGFLAPRLQRRIQRLPSPLYVPAAALGYVAMIAVGNAIGGVTAWSAGLVEQPLAQAVSLNGRVLLYALGISAALVFVTRMRDLLGGEVFANLMLGRYHRPVKEERIFLFVDVVGSTAYAETHGDLAAQEYLSAIFAALAEPVRAHRGAVDDYVGDMAIITWRHLRGVKDARCVACLFAIVDCIDKDAGEWRRRFGQVPQLRAALHGGPVVTAEVGIDRHKIAYFGDVVNTTGRLEAMSRTLGAAFVASMEMLDRLPGLPPGVTARPLGTHALRGRDEPLAIAALERVRP
jgi:adenylate cyclase